MRGSKNDILSFGIAVYNIVSSQLAVFSLNININALDVLAAAVLVISLAKLGDVGNCVLACTLNEEYIGLYRSLLSSGLLCRSGLFCLYLSYCFRNCLSNFF